MNPKIVIRNETPDDIDAIREITVAAFKTLAVSNHTEQFIIEALREAKALTDKRRSVTSQRIERQRLLLGGTPGIL
jgi:predicted N-acetyltransferase YhbS